MGFLESFGRFVGETIKDEIDATKKRVSVAEDAYNEAQSWDDERLIREFKRIKDSNSPKRFGYGKALKERGYGNSSN